MPSNESIKDYNVYEQLGQGGFAQVYRAQVKESSKEVAIKMIDKKSMKASRMTQRVEHEVKIHYQLKHPSILELYTFFEDKNYVYLVLELCQNGEMQRYLKSRPNNPTNPTQKPQHQKSLDEDETRHFLKQVVDGMIYLHSYGILHRDLTLSNLLLTKEMNVKIADFGLATQLNLPEEKHFTMCGTPNFISPEIASRNAHGLEADVWSLGCMMYTFLTGRPPFDTDGIRNTLNKVVHAEFEMPGYISHQAQDLITSLLKKNPLDRIPLSKVLEHPFMNRKHAQSCFKPIAVAAFSNESIDSGRGGTMPLSNNNKQHFLRNRNTQEVTNLATLQSGREEDFTNSLADSSRNTNTNNDTNDSTTTSSLFMSQGFQVIQKSNSKLDNTTPQPDPDSKNLYYNRFIKQQQIPPPPSPVPPSPPVKLSSYSPTKQRSLSQTQQQQLISSSSTSLSTATSSNSNNNSSSQLLSRSNIHLNAQYQYQSSSNEQNYYNQTNNNPIVNYNNNNISRKNSIIPSAASMENINSASSLTDAEHIPTSLSPSSPFMYKQQHQQLLQYQSDDSSSYPSLGSSSASASKVALKKKHRKKTEQVLASDVVVVVEKSLQNSVSPLKTGATLLRPTRQASKNAVLNIMEKNEVVLELIKVKKNQQFIMEVIRIEADLDKITIYQPNNGKGCLISNRPPSPPHDRENYLQFDYKSLPQTYWKKYDLASKFVKMVRSRTPKITLHTELSKCILYDTSPDFEALFYHGAKFHISNQGMIKITQLDGTSISMLDSSSRSTCLSPETQEMLELSHKWHKYCLEIEAIFQRQETLFIDIVSFPLTIGRRPPPPSPQTQISTNTPKNSNSIEDSSGSKYGNSFQHNTTSTSGCNPSMMSNFELKSASTSSLAMLNSNNNTRIYQNDSNVRKLTSAYDSLSSSPSPLTVSNNMMMMNQMSTHSLTSQRQNVSYHTRPQSSSSSSSSNHQNLYQQQIVHNHNSYPSTQQRQTFDNIPISLPQRDLNYFN